jgi:hypothetical protein
MELYNNRLDTIWRLEKHYMKDAKKHKHKECMALLEKLHEHDVAALSLLKKVVANKAKKGLK